mgnify:CR=1 FL=1
MDDKNSIKVIDISKKSRMISVLSVVVPLLLAIITGASSKEEFVIWVIVTFVSFWLSSYLLKKRKTILRVGSIIDKDKRFYLSNNGKKVDTLRIRREEDVTENEVLKRLEDFLIKNNVKQYSKIYIVGSDSKEDVGIVSDILNK